MLVLSVRYAAFFAASNPWRTMTSQGQTAAAADRRSAANMERHLQTVLISIITGSIIFAANYFYTDNRSKAVQQTQLEVLTVQVLEMRADLRALQQNYAKAIELEKLEGRVRVIELERRK